MDISIYRRVVVKVKVDDTVKRYTYKHKHISITLKSHVGNSRNISR